MIEEKKLMYEGVKGVPHIREPGNSIRRHTGDWRVFKPVINLDKCVKCKVCWLFCPEAAINWVEGHPEINYQLCKGCLICANECPVKAIDKVVDKHKD